jgi:hypothetical protein
MRGTRQPLVFHRLRVVARARTVTGPDGRVWKVGRQWVSDRVRLRRDRERDVPEGGEDGWSLGDLFSFDDITPSAVAAGLAIALVGVLLFVVVWPLVALVLELVILLVIFVASVAARVVLRRPWQVVAKTNGPPPDVLSWQVVGWRASRRAISEIGRSLEAGEVNPRLENSPRQDSPRSSAPTG